MFSHSYFCSDYFSGAYFPPATLPLDLLEAIGKSFDVSPLVASGMVGGITLASGGRSDVSPYCVCKETGQVLSRTSDVSIFHTVDLLFEVFGTPLATISPLADQLESYFRSKRFMFGIGGYTGPMVPQGQTHDQPLGIRDSSGIDLWRVSVKFKLEVNRGQ